jgi:L-aspartate semialdehyde sulfurtransferase ferredoxin
VSTKAARLFVTFPEELVSKPMIYEVVQRFEVIPNIRRANVEAHSGWMILELDGTIAARDNAVAWLVDQGCQVNPMEGDVVAG